MTIEVPVESPQGNVLNYSIISVSDDEEDPPKSITLETNAIPIVVLKKLEENEYCVVSPRSSNRSRKIKNFDGYEMDLSITNLKKLEKQSPSPRKRGRHRKSDSDVEMVSPMKIQKTPVKKHNKKDDLEDNLYNLCSSIKNVIKLTTPVKRSLAKADFSDIRSIGAQEDTPKRGRGRPKKSDSSTPIVQADGIDTELTENSSTPSKKRVQESTPIKGTPKKGRGRPKKVDSNSPITVDENEEVSEGSTPSKLYDSNRLKSVKINLDESFRRSVLKSTLNIQNVQKESKKNVESSSPRILKTNSRQPRKSSCPSYASYFFYDSDSDGVEITKGGKAKSAKKRVTRTRSKSSDCYKSTNLSVGSDDDYEANLSDSSSSGSNFVLVSEDEDKKEVVQVRTPSRRKQVHRPRKDSNASEKSETSPERRSQRNASKTSKTLKNENEISTVRRSQRALAKTTRSYRGKRDSESSCASEKSPERRPQSEVAKTPRNRKSIKSVQATPKTPKNRLKLLRDGTITPSMQSRTSIVPGDSTPLMKARSQLHVSYVPTSLPCREKEYLDIYNFLGGKLDDGCGGCMYISGVPGTGKTATVTSVIKNLQNDKNVPKFDYVSINGMRLTEPRQSYVEIWKQLTGKTVPWEQAQSLLEERFTKKKNTSNPVVMLIDELDILCTKRQDVVYNLLDWPTKSKDQLVVITIANTMDLPERLLMSRVTSRLGLTRLTFQAYTHKQLMEIVTKRLTGTNSFNPDAVQLVARKVASVSGDARRALDICRRAAEIAEEEGKDQLVNVMHVNEALQAMITQPQVMAIRRCSRLQKLLLQAIVAEIERTGVEETSFNDVFRMLVSCCALDGFKMVTSTVAQRAVCELSAYRLIISDQKCSNIYQRIMLNVSVHDVYFALKK